MHFEHAQVLHFSLPNSIPSKLPYLSMPHPQVQGEVCLVANSRKKKAHLWKTTSQRQVSFDKKMIPDWGRREELNRTGGAPGITKLQTQLRNQVGDPKAGKVVEVPCSFLLSNLGVKHVHWSKSCESHRPKCH